MRLLLIGAIGVWWAMAGAGPAAYAQTPVFEDLLTNPNKITGQWGAGIFTPNGYVLTHDGGYDEYNNNPRSVDYVWYDRPGVGHDGSGSIEFDVTGLFPNAGCTSNELYCMCDSQGLNPATTGNDFWLSPCYNLLRKWPDNRMKLVGMAGGTNYGVASNYLSWDGATTFRFRVTWSGTAMRIYRGLPGETLALLAPTPFNFSAPWAPQILHMQVGSTFMAGPRHIMECGGAPGTVYSLIRVYEDDIGAVPTPPRIVPTAVSVDLGTTDVVNCMWRVAVVGDGDTVPVNIGGRDARRTQDAANDFYIYFAVEDFFAYQGSKPEIYVLINYYDTGSGYLALQYDSSDPAGQPNPYYKIVYGPALTGSNTWKQYMFHVTDAYLGNRENGSADFRIAKDGGGYQYLDVVAVSGESFVPSQAREPDPANGATKVALDAHLSWTADRADTYSVYFGATNPLPFRGNQAASTYDPGPLDHLVTYFWRIDGLNGLGTTTGQVWRFTTRTYVGDFDEDLDVDQPDFGYFQACLSGSGTAPAPGCENADLDQQGDVDADDFALFQACMGESNQPPGPGC